MKVSELQNTINMFSSMCQETWDVCSFFLHVLLHYTDGKRSISEHVCPDSASHVSSFRQPTAWCTQESGPLSGVIPSGHTFLSPFGGCLKPKPLFRGTYLFQPPHSSHPQISSSGTYTPPAPLFPIQGNVIS